MATAFLPQLFMFYGTGVVSRSMATFTAFCFISRIFTFQYWLWDTYIRGENGIPGRSFHIGKIFDHLLTPLLCSSH